MMMKVLNKMWYTLEQQVTKKNGHFTTTHLLTCDLNQSGATRRRLRLVSVVVTIPGVTLTRVSVQAVIFLDLDARHLDRRLEVPVNKLR